MHSSRSGFTLVEMMVAMTLTMFVMVILSQCFVQGLETFSGLKAIGDMQEELRTATTLLRADLSQDHFEGKRRLSDPVARFKNEKIREGFFVLGSGYPLQPAAANSTYPSSTKAYEGTEDGTALPNLSAKDIPSYRYTDHFLHFSTKMRGNAREKNFAVPVPGFGLGAVPITYLQKFQPPPGAGGTMPAQDAVFQENASVVHSPWAEIVYLLLPTGTTANPRTPPPPGSGAPGTKLCALYRCQYVVLPVTTDANNQRLPTSATSAGIAGIPTGNGMTFYSPNDLARGWSGRTFNPYQYFSGTNNHFNNNTPPPGAALVLSNVLSFQVMAMTSNSGGDFVDLTEIAAVSQNNKYFVPFDTANYSAGPQLPSVPATPPQPAYSIQGLQIIIRIWDPKSRQARQVTLVQDM
jgi:hypothetical protein